MMVGHVLSYMLLLLTACIAEEMVSWRRCPCNFVEGYGTCSRFIGRGIADDTVDLNLNLQSCNIAAIAPGDFPLSRARWVDLRHNRIQRIDENVFKGLTDVLYISLEHNNIRGRLIHPNAFKHCLKLRGIGLAFNDMRNAPDDLVQGLNSLQQLFIYNSLLVKVPIFATNSPSLERLELSNNEITLDNPETFSKLVKLKYLWLDNNRIEFIDENAFKSLRNIETIKLNNNKIAHIPEKLFAGLAKLKFLFLDNNLIEYVPLNMIKDCKSLIEIRISHNRITQLPEDFLSHVTPKKLDFSGNPWQCGCLNEVLIEVKERRIVYNSDDYDGHSTVCIMKDFLCHRTGQ